MATVKIILTSQTSGCTEIINIRTHVAIHNCAVNMERTFSYLVYYSLLSVY